VNVVLNYDISEKHQTIQILEKLLRIEHDLNGLGPSEDGQPANDRAGQEVGERGFSEPIAGASHGSWFLAREDDAERRRRHSHAREAVIFSEDGLILTSVHDIVPHIHSAFSPSSCLCV
jgi:hypothetical protein